MAKKVIKLTESELSEMIKDITMSVLNETDMETYARLWEASKNAQKQLQQGNYIEKVGKVERTRNNDTQFDRSKAIDKDALMSALEKHKTSPFMFFAKSERDFGCRVIFELSSAPKIKEDEIVLDGIVIFNQELRYGKISIKNGIARYRKGNSVFTLTPDNRTKQAWDSLLDGIQKGLEKRKQFDALI